MVNAFERTATASELKENGIIFLKKNYMKKKRKSCFIAGRLMTKRGKGKADGPQDLTGQIQNLCKDQIGEEPFDNLENNGFR